MAFTSSVNNTNFLGSQSIYQLLLTLVTAGWKVKGSGDGGSLFSSSSNILTGFGTSGAGNFGVAASWFRIQSPTTGTAGQMREFIFQCAGGISPSWRIKYSPNPTGATGFIGGSPSATQTPSATDQSFLRGGGTEASPSYTGWLGGDNSYKWHIMAGDSTLNYSFVCWAMAFASASGDGGLMLDSMQGGSQVPSDTDPCVVYIDSGGGGFFGANLRGTDTLGNVGGTASTQFINIPAYLLTNGFPGAMGTDAWNNQDIAVSFGYARSSAAVVAPYTHKGISSLLLYLGCVRGNMDLVYVPGYGYYVYINGTLLPWPSGIYPTR
jgi:hypothetical protein